MVKDIANEKDLQSVFADAKKNGLHVIIDFTATWCPPCKAIAPKFSELAKENEGKIVMVKVDVDNCNDIATEFNIKAMPTFLAINTAAEQPTVVHRMSGANVQGLSEMVKTFSKK